MSKYVDDLKRKRSNETKSSTNPTKKSAPTPSSSLSRIEQLRAERYISLSDLIESVNCSFRLKRESNERTKTAAYLSRVFTGNDQTIETPETTPVVETNDRKRRYNSQFNPDMAKQNSTRYATTHDFNWREH